MATSRNTCNTFIDLNGIPYFNAEYLDARCIQQIDRSAIFSQITVDTTEPLRAIIDINVDDIGVSTKGDLNALGNRTKQKNLLKMINNHAERLGHRLPTLRKGLIVQVNYQIENAKTSKVIRSAVDNFRIENRSYFLDINSSDLNDNRVITCFCDTEVSSMSEFTHGFEPMNLRITNVQLYYEMCKDDIRSPRCMKPHQICNDAHRRDSLCGMDVMKHDCHPINCDYYMHKNMQSVQYIGDPECHHHHHEYCDNPLIANPSWSLINRFYHFDNDAHDMIIHGQEVYNRNTDTVWIPCGTVVVNRLFMINPAHRLVFKFCIWKNDLTVVDDTKMIADTLKVPSDNIDFDMTDTDTALPHRPPHFIHPDDDTFRRILENIQHTDKDQNHRINQLVNVSNTMGSNIEQLAECVGTIQESINKILDKLGMTTPPSEDPPIDETDPTNPGPGHQDEDDDEYEDLDNPDTNTQDPPTKPGKPDYELDDDLG